MSALYSAAIQINPRWDERDRAIAQEMLIYKIAKETQIDRDEVRRRATVIDRSDFGDQRLLVVSIPCSEPRLIIPVEW